MSRSKPGFRRGHVFYFHQRIGGASHMPITKADQALNVGVVYFAHSNAIHSLACSWVIDDLSSPWRMRVFLSRSTALEPGYALYHTWLGNVWRRRYSLYFRSSM